MSDTISAIYADGVFRPLEPVDWPEGTKAEVVALRGTQAAEAQLAWPAGYFERTAAVLAGEDFERPPQGDFPARETW